MLNSDSTIKLLDQFRRVNATFPETAEIKETKAGGKRVFGWLCSYVPEELIYAAGALPVRITGYQNRRWNWRTAPLISLT